MLLSAIDFEVLYGGAAGAGKSDGLLLDALGIQQNAIGNRNYQAILFRRTFPDLRDLIDRSQELYPYMGEGGKYDKTSHIWTWPSGARIESEQDPRFAALAEALGRTRSCSRTWRRWPPGVLPWAAGTPCLMCTPC